MSLLSRDLPDHDARNRAVTDFQVNLIVEAGAGTGKTSLLVERILVALGSGHAAIEEITAITFTEKAAAEMRTRLATALERLLSRAGDREGEPDPGAEADRALSHLEALGVPAERVRSRVLEAISRIDRARVVTIHGFCASLLRDWPMEAGVDPAFEVDQGDHYDRIREDEWERFVIDDLSSDGHRHTLWRRLLETVGMGPMGTIAFRLARFDIPREIRDEPDRTVDPLDLFGDELSAFLGDASGLLEHLDPKKKKPPLSVQVLESLHRTLTSGYDGGRACLLESLEADPFLKERMINKPKYAPTGPDGFIDVDVDHLAATVRLGMMLLVTLATADDDTCRAILELSAPFAERCRNRLLQEGFVGFDGLLTLARDLLRDRPMVRDPIRCRMRMLMVDEFQDTDPMQYEIVLYLAEQAGGSAADPFEAELEPGRLFVVGDPKQSIYRFRGADYAAFRRAVDRIEEQGGVRLDLSANFRTVPEILEPVNHLFDSTESNGWRAEEPYQPPYLALNPTRSRQGAPAVELWTTEAPEEDGRSLSARQRRTVEAEAIAAWIRDAVTSDDDLHHREIMILVRAYGDLEIYLRGLREAGIPYVVDGGKGFMERPEVTQLIATTRAVALPSDQAALLSYLRSPAGAVSDVQLAAYADAGGEWDWRTVDAVDRTNHAAVHEAFTLLRDMAAAVCELPVDAALAAIVRMTMMKTTAALAFEGFQRVVNLDKICAVASDLARDGRMSLVELATTLEDERFTESDSESPMADEGTDAVRVLSIHKAKGLESRIVVVPDLARAPGNQNSPALEATRLPGGCSVPSINIPGLRNLASFFHEREERAHDRAETIRLLYVALTRAKEHLIVVTGAADRRARWAEAIRAWNDLDGILHRVIGAGSGKRAASGPVEILDTAALSAAYKERVDGCNRRAIRPLRAPSDHDEERFTSEGVDALPRAVSDRDAAKALGTAVHLALENWNPAEGPLHSNHPEAMELLRGFAAGPLGDRFRSIDIVGREVPMLLQDEHFAWRGSIDLLYREDGGYVVADFKTDTALTEDRRKNYGEQLQRYAEAVAQATKQPVRCELWMVRSGEVLSV